MSYSVEGNVVTFLSEGTDIKDGIALGQVLVTGDNRNVSAGPFSKSVRFTDRKS